MSEGFHGMPGQNRAVPGAPAATMACPKCGFEQPESPECVRCGIFVARFLEKARLAEETRIIQESIAEKQALYARPREQAVDDDDDFFGPEKKGIEHGMAGGIAMMTIATVWFGLGWKAGVIFYYPPILFLIGAFAFLKGLSTGNVSGA
jgi:hypothetical protein